MTPSRMSDIESFGFWKKTKQQKKLGSLQLWSFFMHMFNERRSPDQRKGTLSLCFSLCTSTDFDIHLKRWPMLKTELLSGSPIK